MDNNSKSARVLVDAGIANPARVVKKMRDTIELLQLDLSGLSVLTEAASGPFVVTPIIAALAGAREVIAITGDSRYATVDEVVRQTRALESLCGIEGQTEIHASRDGELFARPDIVTNLGFVRPLDRNAISRMRAGAVISLMCESWEFREGDLDFDACRSHGIAVYGTNEDFPGLDVFSYSGWVAIQLLLEAQVEVHKSKIVVIGSDKFAAVIARLLARAGVDAYAHARLDPSMVHDADAILVADYSRLDPIIGTNGDMTAADVASLNPAVTVVLFAGLIDLAGLQNAGITVYPGHKLSARRMERTLAALGPRPVIELHAAGLKVGHMAVSQVTSGSTEPFAQLPQKLI